MNSTNSHPKNWYIPLTDENYDEVKAWWIKQVETSGWGRSYLPYYALVLSHHPTDPSHYWSGSESHFNETHPSYQKITIEQFRQITNPLPEHWYITVTEENINELNRWRLSKRTINAEKWDSKFIPGAILLSEHPHNDGSYFWTKYAADTLEKNHPEYKPITIEQFRQITTQTLKPMSKSIQISRTLLNEYYEAATTPQKEYLIEHFKLDGTTTDEAIRGLYEMACGAWKPRIKKNHPDCFTEDSKHFDFSNRFDSHGLNGIVSSDVCESLGLRENFIQIRNNSGNPATHCRSFYLTDEYNWELVRDDNKIESDVWVLIPTKKLK